ncbi:MAG: macro domain-containing protein [Bacteroidota bacterium]
MIRYLTGNLLQAQADALVNTVNTVGVMGKGIALQFKEAFPENFHAYAQAVKAGEVKTGQMFVTQVSRLDGPKVIVNFPTKQHWRSPSQYPWIEEGLKDLVKVIHQHKIHSIAIPPLGCGNGRLDWAKVKAMMEQCLGPLHDVDIQIYQPNQHIREVLAKEASKKEARLTPARAELLYLLFLYETSGEETSLFIANKLAYFLQRMGDKQLKLRFQRHHYGPYSDQVGHVMYALNGTFITGLEQREAKAFERLQLRYDRFPQVQKFVEEKLNADQQTRLQTVLSFIEGFQSPLSMEALATVDTILTEQPEASTDQIYQQIQAWSDRKKQLFSTHHIQVAYKRVQEYRQALGFA